MQNKLYRIWKIAVLLLLLLLLGVVLLLQVIFTNSTMQEKKSEVHVTNGSENIILKYNSREMTVIPKMKTINNADSWYINIVGVTKDGKFVPIGDNVTYKANLPKDSITIFQKDDTVFNKLDKVILDIVFVNVPCMQTIELDIQELNSIIDIANMKLKVKNIQCNESDYTIEFVPLTNEKNQTILYLESLGLIKQQMYEQEGEEILAVTINKETLINDILVLKIQSISFKSENWVMDI